MLQRTTRSIHSNILSTPLTRWRRGRGRNVYRSTGASKEAAYCFHIT
ncbi:unnamed protein product [Nezara viridula]|uniref:Uncharacterized protein n=1 Tax=Nezara viridula TaxID=85310 RepID=A0A9P0H0Z3_NEZVI|nr:unnamed protein product [Nezara viridula]